MSVVSFTKLRALTNIVLHQCVLLQTQKITNFFISGTSTSKIIIFQFFGPYLHLFLEWMETHLFWARPFKIAQAFFTALGLLFLDAFLKKRMAPPTWQSKGSPKCRIEMCN